MRTDQSTSANDVASSNRTLNALMGVKQRDWMKKTGPPVRPSPRVQAPSRTEQHVLPSPAPSNEASPLAQESPRRQNKPLGAESHKSNALGESPSGSSSGQQSRLRTPPLPHVQAQSLQQPTVHPICGKLSDTSQARSEASSRQLPLAEISPVQEHGYQDFDGKICASPTPLLSSPESTISVPRRDQERSMSPRLPTPQHVTASQDVPTESTPRSETEQTHRHSTNSQLPRLFIPQTTALGTVPSFGVALNLPPPTPTRVRQGMIPQAKRQKTGDFGSTMKNSIHLIDVHIANHGGYQSLNAALERPRFTLLRDACDEDDWFYVALHQLFCLWSIDPNALNQLEGFNATKMAVAFQTLGQLIRDNSNMAVKHLQFFASFPSQLMHLIARSDQYRRSIASALLFLSKLQEGWQSFTAACQTRGYPPLIDELIRWLGLMSPVLQGIVFTATRRNLGIQDDQYGNHMELLFTQDRDGHRALARRMNTDRPPSLKEVEERNRGILETYHTIAADRQKALAALPAPHSRTNSTSSINGRAKTGNNTPSSLVASPISAPATIPSGYNPPRQIMEARSAQMQRAMYAQNIPTTQPSWPQQPQAKRTSTGRVQSVPSTQQPMVASGSHSNQMQHLQQQMLQQQMQQQQQQQQQQQHQQQQLYYLYNDPIQAQQPVSNRTQFLAQPPSVSPQSHQLNLYAQAQAHALGQYSQQHHHQQIQAMQQHSPFSSPVYQFPSQQFPGQRSAAPSANPQTTMSATPVVPSQTWQTTHDVSTARVLATNQRVSSQPGTYALGPTPVAPRTARPALSTPTPQTPNTGSTPNRVDHAAISRYNAIDPLKRILVPPHGWQALPQPPNPDLNALHQVYLQSPALSTLKLNEAPIRYYQMVRELAVGPEILSKASQVFTYKFTVPGPTLSLLAEDQPVTNGTSRVRRVSANSLQYRARCTATSKTTSLTPSQWVVSDTMWPQAGFFLEFNECVVDLRRKSQHGKDTPVDVTPFVASSIVKSGQNQVQISYLRFGEPFKNLNIQFAVEVISIMSHEEIMERVTVYQRKSTEETLHDIKARLSGPSGDDDDIQMVSTDLTIGLRDPFMSKIYDVPVRSTGCLHPECFDLETFLLTRPCRPKFPGEPCMIDVWRCPLCGCDARPFNLRLDEYMVGVREKLASDGMLEVRDILIDAEGRWKPKPEALPNKRAGDKDDEDTDTDEDKIPLKQSTSMISIQAPKKIIEIVELDDD